MIEDIINNFVDYVVSDSNLYFSFDYRKNEVIIKKINNEQGTYLNLYSYLKENPKFISDFKEFLIEKIKLYNSNQKIKIRDILLFISGIVMYVYNGKEFDFDRITHSYDTFYFILSIFNKAFENDTSISSKLLDLNNKFAKNEFMDFRTIIDNQEKVYNKQIQSSIKINLRTYIYDLITPINILNFLINNYSPFTDEQRKYTDLTYIISILNKQQKIALLKHILNKGDKLGFGDFHLTDKTKEYLIDKYFKNEFLKLSLKSF